MSPQHVSDVDDKGGPLVGPTHQPAQDLVDITFQDQALIPVWEKVLQKKRLSREDGLSILNTWDLVSLGRMADHVKRSMSGDHVYFVINRQLNPTNLCVLDCKFCDFAAKPLEPHAYEMSMDQVLSHVSEELSEVHIVGGLHPTWTFDQYLDIMKAIHEAYPRVQIKAWTAVEIDWFARIAEISIEEVLHKLREVGLASLPGGVPRSSPPESGRCSSRERSERSAGSRCTGSPIGWAFRRTQPCSTGTSRPTKREWITC